jgi:hypothetical protein
MIRPIEEGQISQIQLPLFPSRKHEKLKTRNIQILRQRPFEYRLFFNR